jgi:non-specific serine/threonine protein kinase
MHVAYEARTCEALGQKRFRAAHEAGLQIGFENAVAFALGAPAVAAERARTPGGGSASAGLTAREFEVAQLVARGLTNKQIAAALVISLRTAEGHVEHILTKLGFSSRAKIATWMTELEADQHRTT